MLLLQFVVLVACLFTVFAAAPAADEQVILITGCSSGIGKAAALALAEYSPKFKVYATMRQIADWGESTINNIVLMPIDVTSDKSVQSAVDTIIKNEGRIDIVINNAGVGLGGTLELVHISDAKALFEVNVWGPVRILQSALPHMRKARAGYVINLSSTSGIRGLPGMEMYTGSKFALEGIMDSMRYSLAPFNIAVTNINAGPVRTNITKTMGTIGTPGGKPYRQIDDKTQYLSFLSKSMLENLNRRMESDEAQSPEDIAQVIINLVVNRKHARTLSDIPFNIGTSTDSQRVLEMVRKHPTGWGGIYTSTLQALPQPPNSKRNKPPPPPPPPVQEDEGFEL